MTKKKISHADKRNAPVEEQLPMLDEEDAAAPPKATPAQIAAIIKLAKVQFKQETAVAKADEALKKAKRELNITCTVDMPKLMKAAGMDTCPLNNGYRVDIDKVINASIPSLKSKKEDAEERNRIGIDYMLKHGPGLIDTVLVERYAHDQQKELKKRLAENKRRKVPIEFEVSQTVNTARLQAWIRERDEKGIETDADALNIHRVEVSKIVKPKETKKAKAKIKT